MEYNFSMDSEKRLDLEPPSYIPIERAALVGLIEPC